MKFFFFTLLLSFALLNSHQSQAALQLNIEIVHNRGIDEKLVLVAELHSSEILIDREWHRLEMQYGLILYIRGQFVSQKDLFGPSDMVRFEGYITNQNQTEKILLAQEVVDIKLGESKSLVLKRSTDQLIHITLTPLILN